MFKITSVAVEIDAHRRVRDSTIRHLLLDQILPLALAAEGHLVLHASAVSDAEANTIALAGSAGAGKSTLAAALTHHGWRVTSDDGVLVEQEDATVVAVPAYPGLRLWADAAEATGFLASGFTEVAEYSAKLRVHPAGDARAEAGPLRRVYLLERGDEHRIDALTPRDAAMALVHHAYRADVTDRAALAAQLHACAEMARRVPISRLAVPRDLARVETVAHALSAHAKFGDS